MTRVTSIRSAGFTLVELIIAIILIGILSAIVMTRINAKAQHSVTTQADQLRRNLSHIQLLAISQGARLKLAVAAGNYSVCPALTVDAECPGNNATNAIGDPATGEKFSVNLTDGVVFTQPPGYYHFDSLGRPVSGATGATLVLGTSTFRLNGVDRNTPVIVTVLPITGFAQTSY